MNEKRKCQKNLIFYGQILSLNCGTPFAWKWCWTLGYIQYCHWHTRTNAFAQRDALVMAQVNRFKFKYEKKSSWRMRRWCVLVYTILLCKWFLIKSTNETSHFKALHFEFIFNYIFFCVCWFVSRNSKRTSNGKQSKNHFNWCGRWCFFCVCSPHWSSGPFKEKNEWER